MSERDPQFEEVYLEQVVEEAQRRAGVDVSAYVQRVRDRLELGAERYQDDGFLNPDRDNLAEVCDETPDVAGYSLLELQALNRGPSPPDGVHHHLFEASVHAAIADWHARQARRARARA